MKLASMWRWSWLLTFPIAIAFGHWVLATANRYADFGVRISLPTPLPLLEVGQMEFHQMIRQAKRLLSLAPAARNAMTPELRRISLYVPEAAMARLDSNLPHSGSEYVDAGLWEGDKLRRVEVRYRGDNVYHWGYFKKSWRVKTKRDTLYDGMRIFNLIAPITPEILNNYLGYRLSAVLGLISPRVELVDVSINGRLSGIHILTEQLSEITLRGHGLMPGDLYSGEIYGREAYTGVSNLLFSHSGIWEKQAVNNHYDEASFAPLEYLISLIRRPQTEAVQGELARILDLEAFGRFNALEILSATAHYDIVHNWRLYYDPWRSKFVPVVWDPMGWHRNNLPRDGGTARLDVITTPLHAVLYRNGDFLRSRQRALSEFFGSGEDLSFLKDVDEATALLDRAVDQDPNLAADFRVLTPDETRAAMRDLKGTIARSFREIRAGYLAEPGGLSYSYTQADALALRVTGRRPVDRLVLRYAKNPGGDVSAKIRFWRDGNPVERDVSDALVHAGTELELQLPLLPQFVPVLHTLRFGSIDNYSELRPGYYELTLEGVRSDVRLLEVLADRGGDHLEPSLRVQELDRSSFDGMFSIVRDRPVQDPLVLDGEIIVDRTLDVNRDAIIMPGTTLRMKPGASVVFRSRVWAGGTTDQPIRILPAELDQEPWGTVALQGPGANGSTFRYCQFIGGSGYKGGMFEYSAMLSMHDVRGVSLEHCRLSDSRVVDDMVHAVYADVRMSDCVFERALFDAVDLDITEGVIERCEFVDSGNDGLDLMTSRVVVLDSVLHGNKDKGISVGEDTRLLALRCRFLGNNIGVESKDRSVAVLYNADLIGNGLALNAYDKNWQYEGGGFTYLYKGRLQDNADMVQAHKGSGIWIHDTYLDRRLDPDLARVEADDTVDDNPAVSARVTSFWRFPTERERMGEFAESYWASADPAARGAMGIGR